MMQILIHKIRLWHLILITNKYASVKGAGTLSLYAASKDLSASDKSEIESNIDAFSDTIKSAFDSEGYHAKFDFPYDYD